jgi:hypothetical protein
MLTTTLNRIQAECHPTPVELKNLLRGLGKTVAGRTPLPYSRIVESVGLYDAIWYCRAEPKYAEAWRQFAVWGATQVRPWMADRRSRHAVRVVARYARGDASLSELAQARQVAGKALAKAEEEEIRIGWSEKGGAPVCAAASAARVAYAATHPQAHEAIWGVMTAIAEGAWDASGWSISSDEAWDIAIAAMQQRFLQIVGAPER